MAELKAITGKMGKILIPFIVSGVLTAGCEQNDAAVERMKEEASPIKNVSVADNLVFTEREPDHTSDQIQDLIGGYQKKLVEAINMNTFSSVEPFLLPGSSLYNSQKELVSKLSSRKIKERFVSSEIYGYTIEKDRFRVEVSETVEVDYPNEAPRSNDYHWIYTVEQRDGKFYLSQLEEWKTYQQDMNQRMGSVKADGYYAGELLRNYPKILEEAINTLDITEIKQLSKNDTVFQNAKELISELRKQGSEFSLKASSINEDWNTLTFVQEISYQFTDKEHQKQSGSRKINLQLDEIRKNFQGYAVIGYLEDATKDPIPSSPGSVVIHEISRIHPSLPEFLFKVYGKEDGPEQGTFFTADKIEIYQAGVSGRLIQEIPLNKTRTTDGRTLGLVVEDMDFDGYKDIRIQSGIPAGPNIPYLYWIWDQKAGAYISNPDLEQITSPVFDSDSQTIQSFVRESAASYSENTYRYIDKIPTLINRIERVADPEKKVWHVTVSERNNNQLNMVKQYDEPLDN